MFTGEGWGRLWWLPVVVAVGCSQHHDEPLAGASDASTGAQVEVDPSAGVVAARVVSTLSSAPELSARFGPNPDGFRGGKDGVVSAGWRAAWTERDRHVGARLASSANRPFEAGVGVSELYRLTLEQVGAAPSPLSIDEGRAVYRDVYPSTDVTFAASPARLEWAYTLRDEKAPTEFKLAVQLPKHLRAPRPDVTGGLELLDDGDQPLLRIPRAIAVDAAGARRDVPVLWDGNALTVRLDASGLQYPIVIDPAIETVVWQPRVLLPAGRSAHMSVYDTVRKRIVIFGGSSPAGTQQDTWEWDGAVWSLRATAGPSARADGGMAFDSSRGVAVLFGGSSGGGETWEWDGVAWTQRCTTAPCSSTRPPAREGARMAFDPVRGKTVLFGGLGTAGTLSDTWTWNGTAWTAVGGTAPSARYSHGLAWDSTGSRVLLFGGRTGTSGTNLNDVWSFNGTSWSSVTTSGGPPPARYRFAFTFQNHNGRALVHGGANAGYLYDTWEFVSSTNSWVSATAGPGRSDGVAAYDSDRQAVVMMGGVLSNALSDTWEFKDGVWTLKAGDRDLASTAFDSFRNRLVRFGGAVSGGVAMNDTWEYTGFGWTQVCTTAPCSTTVPPARHGAIGAYDSARKRFVVFGGGGYSDTWEYDGSVWTERCTGTCTKPSAKWGALAAYDSARGKVVMFGGSNGSAETWEWDGTSWTQVCTSGSCATTIPPARYFGGMTFDSTRNRIVMFGGQNPSTSAILGDTWEYTGSAWIQVATTGPSARHRLKLAFDPLRKKTILFGGESATGATGDTWEWNGTSWTQTATTGPGSRDGASLDYDVARRRIVMSGGTGLYRYGDTWEYYSRGGSCAIGTDCATGFCVDGVCCEQLSCGTCQACDTSGSPGSCASVTNADDSDSCPSATATCDAAGTCRKKQGQSCTASTQCASGFCADGYCCNAACNGGCDVCSATPGTCTLLAKGASGTSCGAYFCDGASGTCPTSCAVDGDCAAGYFCASGGICQARRAQGGSCNVAAGGDCNVAGCRECSGTLTCKDGYCCNGGCVGSCRTCAATPGTCTDVTSGDDLDTCTGTNTCSSGGTCLAKNGQTCTAATQCASGNCVDGFCCDKPCNGKCNVCNATPGTCTAAAQGSAGSGATCGAYVCDGSSPVCPTSCGNDADCASGYYCGAAGTCLARKAQGSTCNTAAGADCKSAGCRSCASNQCIDGFCCDTACGGACDACNGATLGWPSAVNGTCTLAPASYAGSPACVAYACNGTSASCSTSCTSDAQCGSGYYCNAAGACVSRKAQGATCNLATDCKVSGTCRACATGNCVDGFCCNTACGGQCQACDVTGAQGTCVTVTGSVHVSATRTACPGTGACAARCNGVDATKCNYPGSALSCGTTSCTSGVATSVGTCDGAGACNQATTSCGAYLCDTTTCRTTCTTDAQCASGFYCKAGSCTGKETNGAKCSGASACASGNCVDGVCCGSASCGSGQRCDLVGTLGKCAKANGVACTGAAECGSGFCVDGVCCDTRCDAQCAACDATGKVGTCSAVTGAPHGARSACAGTGAGTTCGPVCNGTDMAACHYPTGSTSCGEPTCKSSSGTYVETHVSTCNGAGSCSDEPKTCGGFTCGGTACKTTCSASSDCATGYYCKSGACIPIEGLGTSCSSATTCTSGFCTDGVCCAVGSCGAGKSCSAGAGTLKGICVSLNGTACTADAECASGACVDGVCCDSACNGPCQACNQVGSIGKCVPVVGTPLPGHPACTGASTDADCAARCDGTDGTACKYPGTTASCGKPSCGGGTETQVSTCDGAGTCKPASKTCAPYVCGTTACLSGCTTNADCASGNYCKSGSCVKVEGLGKVCGSDAECASGFCADGVCCSVASCGEGSSCAAADTTTPGACLKKKGVACTKADDCASGRCVDGVCCDTACNGQCEACDVSGSEGTCTPVVGVPHGTERKACDEKADDDCGKAQCDGKTRDRCEGYKNGGTVACGAESCTADKRFQKKGACDGAGGCAMPDPKPCTPYVCDVASPTGCKTSCAADEDCVTDYRCDGGVCVQGAKCSDDGLSSIDKSGASSSCSPYRCGSDGKCATSCGSSGDCAPGTICDTTVKACVVLQIEAQEGDGGCTQSPRGPRSVVGILGALFALGAMRRRRVVSRQSSVVS